jgi:hypothetical protein
MYDRLGQEERSGTGTGNEKSTASLLMDRRDFRQSRY